MKPGRVMLTGPHKRFAIEATAGGRFIVRDADTVTDAQVRARIRPEIVGDFASLNCALSWIRKIEVDA